MRHRFHAICPYFAMFPETFVERWIGQLTQEEDAVIDPFCGRGTTPFQALLMNRNAVACDINPVAYCITKAKTNAPTFRRALHRLEELEAQFAWSDWEGERRRLPPFFRYAYHPATLRQILYLRRALRWRRRNTDAMLAAVLLGALHGESHKSPAYLSNQMPRTISTKPDYSIRFWKRHGLFPPKRDVFDVLRQRLGFRYESALPSRRAKVFNLDMRRLPIYLRRLPSPVRCAITSPPYLNVTNYEEDQWLRLWFLGGPPYPTTGRISRDDRHTSAKAYWRLIADMWKMLGRILASNSHVVLRIGAKHHSPDEIASHLLQASASSCRKVVLAEGYEVSRIEGRQTRSFRPDVPGCAVEVDFHFLVQ